MRKQLRLPSVWLLVVIAWIAKTPEGFSQLTIRLSADPVLVNERLALDGMTLEVQNPTKLTGQVKVQIYADRFQSKLFASSNSFLISQSSHLINLNDIFNENNIVWSESDKVICLVILREDQLIPLGQSCSELNQKQSQSTKNNKAKEFLDLDMVYRTDIFPTEKDLPMMHSLNYQGSIKAAGIPIGFNGVLQKNNDPYLGYNISNHSLYFDVQTWKNNMAKKANEIHTEQKDSLLREFTEYKQLKKRYDYIERALSSPEMIKEIASFDSLTTYFQALDLSPEKDLPKLRDSLNLCLDKIKEDNSSAIDSLADGYDKATNSRIDSLDAKIASIEKIIDLKAKKDAYEKMVKIRESSASYIKEAEKIIDRSEQEFSRLLNSPEQLNKFLNQHGQGNKLNGMMNHISDLALGNFNPGFSRLVLQNNQLIGGILGVGYGDFELSGFHGKTRSSDLLVSSDTLLGSTHLTGAKLNYNHGNISQSFFGIFNSQQGTQGYDETKMILGYTTDYTLNDRSSLELEVAWSGATNVSSAVNTGENSGMQSLIKSSASYLKYNGSSKNNKVTANTALEYYGPDYYDFNNPFLNNNSLTSTSNISVSPLNVLRIGGNVLLQKSAIWDTFSEKTDLVSGGINISLAAKKWPVIQYIYNKTKSSSTRFDYTGDFHSINVSNNYKVKDFKMQSFFNLSYVNNVASQDTVQNQFISFSFNQATHFTKNISLLLTGNFARHLGNNIDLINSRNYNYQAELNLLFKKVNVTPGFELVLNRGEHQLGWNIDISVLINKHLGIDLSFDSLWYHSRINEQGILERNFIPRGISRVKYNF